MDFVIGLPLWVERKDNSYNAILVIVDRLIKIVHYKVVKTIINVSRLAEVIINVVVRCYGLLKLIISDCSSLLTSKFWSLLCYFLNIKYKLFIVFYP